MSTKSNFLNNAFASRQLDAQRATHYDRKNSALALKMIKADTAAVRCMQTAETKPVVGARRWRQVRPPRKPGQQGRGQRLTDLPCQVPATAAVAHAGYRTSMREGCVLPTDLAFFSSRCLRHKGEPQGQARRRGKLGRRSADDRKICKGTAVISLLQKRTLTNASVTESSS